MEPILNTNSQRPIENSTGVLVLGILSIAGCCCYGLPGLIMGVIALVLAGSGKKAYDANPMAYTQGSLKNLNAGKICAIIGIALSALFLVMAIIGISTIGWEEFMEAAQSGDPDAVRELLEGMQNR